MSDSPPPNNITPEKGRTAWVHIGCEKTGTSSIQKFLLENQQTLTSEGLYFPIECGLLSNHRLHWIIEDNPDHHPFIYDPESGLGDCLNAGREKITEEHYSKVKAFQRDHTHGSHVVYSSEHLHSRVYDPQVIQNLKDWLSPLYDRIKVVVLTPSRQTGSQRLQYTFKGRNYRYFYLSFGRHRLSLFRLPQTHRSMV